MKPSVAARLRLVLVVTALAAALVLASCSPGADAPSTVAAEALSPAGTDLGDGFEVAEGSSLIAAPIPAGTTVVLSGKPIKDDGWTAWLYVDGDPQTVVDRYLAQASRRGLRAVDLPTGEVFAEEGEEVPPTAFTRCGAVSDGRYACAAAAGDGRRRCLSIDLSRTRRVSVMELRLFLNAPDQCGPGGLAADPSVSPPPAPTASIDLPGTGQPLGERWDVLGPVRVQEGSKVVAGPLPNHVAVLAVDGDADAVLDRYLSEFRRVLRVEPVPYREDVEDDGRRLERHVLRVDGGGDTMHADLVVGPDDEAWLFLSGFGG